MLARFLADNGMGAANDSILLVGYLDLLIAAQSYEPSLLNSIRDSYDNFMDRLWATWRNIRREPLSHMQQVDMVQRILHRREIRDRVITQESERLGVDAIGNRQHAALVVAALDEAELRIAGRKIDGAEVDVIASVREAGDGAGKIRG